LQSGFRVRRRQQQQVVARERRDPVGEFGRRRPVRQHQRDVGKIKRLRDFFAAAADDVSRPMIEVSNQFFRFERAVPERVRLAPEDEGALWSLGRAT
jgi:hypothetical protein